ncbi:MAG: Nodulation protein Z (NodZ) [Phormidium sp. OSCR]|nr:MAG: Nodulation protein Z (NodZ) [Phormidium sp. OSCR]
MKIPLPKVESYLRSVVISVQLRYPEFKIFVATDSQEVLLSFENKFPNVISISKWFSASGQRLHQNPQECQDLVQNGIEALMDLYLLAACDSLIFASRSSFSFLASLLMTNPNHRCYDIDRNKSLIKQVELKLKRILGR